MSAVQEQIKTLVDQAELDKDPFISEAIRNTAIAIVEDAAQVSDGQRVLIWFDPPALPLVKEMKNRCLARGAEVRFFMRDYEGDAVKIAKLDKDGIQPFI